MNTYRQMFNDDLNVEYKVEICGVRMMASDVLQKMDVAVYESLFKIWMADLMENQDGRSN